MEKRTLLGMIGLLAFAILTLNLVSAASLSIDDTTVVIPENISHNAGSFQITFELENTGESADIDWDASEINQDATFEFSHDHINEDQTISITATINFPAHKSGVISGTIVADPSGRGGNVELSFSVQITESSTLSIEITTPLTKTQNGTITITNTGNQQLSDITLTSEEDADFSITFDDAPFTLPAGDSKIIEISSADVDKLKLGDDNILTITATSEDITREAKIIIELSYCELGVIGDLKISYFDISNLDGKDEEWKPLDEIEIEVEIENRGNDDIDDIILEILVMDGDKDVTKDFKFDKTEINLGDIDEDDEKIGIFRISELPADLKDGTYRIYIKAYSEDEEETQCIDNKDSYKEIEIKREEDSAVIIKDYEFTKIAKAGDTIELRLNVYNIGKDKEDHVLVLLDNSELNIDERINIRNLRSGRKEEVVFTIKIPESAESKEYNLRISTYFDYDKGDILETASYDLNSIDDLDVTYRTRLTITQEQQIPTITAVLDSSAKVGEELVVRVSIANHEDATEFIIAATNYEEWATLLGVEPSILNINKGSTGQTQITLKPTEAGTKTFTVNVIYNGQTIEQAVQLNIAEKTGPFTGAFSGLGDTGLYIIAIVVLILIIIIIILIVKVSSGPRAEEF